MTSIASFIARNRSALGWAAAGLALFILGFVVLHGREAMHSGSWKYTLTHDDEYAFWVIADGFADSPISDGNPFYHEQAGIRNPLVAYPVVSLAGWAAAVLEIPVIYLMPVWKIFAPFFTWVVLWWCLVRFWGVPLRAAGAMAMLVFALPFFLHGPAQFAPLRFSRPLDTQWLVVVWLSLAFHPERAGRWWYPAVGASILLVFFLSPFYAAFGLWTLGVGGVLGRVTCREMSSWRLMFMAAFGGVAGLGFIQYISTIKADSPWLSATLGPAHLNSTLINLCSLAILAVALAGVILLRRGFSWSKLDVVLISILSIEGFLANVYVITGHDFRLNEHRYYFLFFELLIAVGWLAQSIPKLNPGLSRKIWEVPLILGLVALEGVILTNPWFNFFRHFVRISENSLYFDNSLLFLELIPLLGVAVWVVRRSPLGRFLVQPKLAAPLIAAFVVAGYATQSAQLRDVNKDMPFAGAHEYLARNSSPGDVLLPLPWNYGGVSYAPLYSQVKLYYNRYGQRLLGDGLEHDYRAVFYETLQTGQLNETRSTIAAPLSMKLEFLRLNYILVERGVPHRAMEPAEDPPNYVRRDVATEDLVLEQLGQHLTVLYEDTDCILWLVTPKGRQK